MAKIDLDGLSIEELAALRDGAIAKLAEKVAARQAELEAELAQLQRYGVAVKKTPAVAKLKKDGKDEGAKDVLKDTVKAA